MVSIVVLTVAASAFLVTGLVVALCGYLEREVRTQTLRFAQSAMFIALAGTTFVLVLLKRS